MSSFPIRKMLFDIAESYRFSCENKGIEWRNNINTEGINDIMVYGDFSKIQAIIMTFIDNAIKYTEHGHIEIRLTVQKEDNVGLTIILEVEDTGQGIPKSIKLFEHFGKINASMSRQESGVGLSLFMAKRLVDLMRGDIGYASDLGKGSVFWLTLSLDKVPELADKKLEIIKDVQFPKNENDYKGRPLNVLIVEDNPMNTQLLMKMLEKIGFYNVDTAENGKKGLEQFIEKSYDLIIMDIQMPIMDGYESTARIREHERNNIDKHAIIIAVTANGHDTKYLSFDAGADDFMTKPVFMKQLQVLIDKWFPFHSKN